MTGDPKYQLEVFVADGNDTLKYVEIITAVRYTTVRNRIDEIFDHGYEVIQGGDRRTVYPPHTILSVQVMQPDA